MRRASHRGPGRARRRRNGGLKLRARLASAQRAGGMFVRFRGSSLQRLRTSKLIVVVSLAALVVLATCAISRADGEPKRVLMLHSFGLRFKPWTEYAQIIRSEISRRFKAPIDFHDHSLLTARLDDDQSDRPFVNYLHSLYAGKAPDLIVAIGAPAANFVQRYRESIFPGVPMLFTVVEARRVQYDKLTSDDTVVGDGSRLPGCFREHPARIASDQADCGCEWGVSKRTILAWRATARNCLSRWASGTQVLQ